MSLWRSLFGGIILDSRNSLPERILLAHGGRVPPVQSSFLRRALELLRGSLFLPLTCFIWALYIARIAYLVFLMWFARSTRVPSLPHQASPIRSSANRIFRFIEAMID